MVYLRAKLLLSQEQLLGVVIERAEMYGTVISKGRIATREKYRTIEFSIRNPESAGNLTTFLLLNKISVEADPEMPT